MSVVLRRVDYDEYLEHKAVLDYALTSTSPHAPPEAAEQAAMLGYLEGGTPLLLFDAGKVAAGAVSSPMMQNVRQALLPAGGVWDVATLPENRRKGYARRLVEHLLVEMHDQGLAVSALYPFRDSFYEQLGYVTLPAARTASLNPQALAPLLRTSLPGRVRREFLAQEFDAYYDYLACYQRTRHGMLLRSRTMAHARLHWHGGWLATAELEGAPVGIMAYRIAQKTLTASLFFYSSLWGRALLLEWLARHIDQVTTAELTLPPGEYPETWFPDLEVSLRRRHAPMVRIVDVQRLAGMEVGEGEFTARIHDPQCPWNNQTYHFRAVEHRLQIEPAQGPGLDLTIQGLAALVYGVHEPADLPVRGWGAPNVTAQETLHALFPRQLPYLFEAF